VLEKCATLATSKHRKRQKGKRIERKRQEDHCLKEKKRIKGQAVIKKKIKGKGMTLGGEESSISHKKKEEERK